MRPLRKYRVFTIMLYGLAVMFLVWVPFTLFWLFPSDREREFVAAAASGDYRAMTRHIEDGIDIDAVDKEFTALTVAAGRGDLPMVKFLLDNGAEIDSPAGAEHTALFWAAFNGHRSVVEYLLQSDASIEDAHPNGAKAFIQRIESRNEGEIAGVLSEFSKSRQQ